MTLAFWLSSLKWERFPIVFSQKDNILGFRVYVSP